MSNEKKIIWLASYPKSGNTWIRIALNLALEGKINLNEIKINSFSGLIKSYLEPTIKLKNPGEIINYWESVQKSISNETSKGSYTCLKTQEFFSWEILITPFCGHKRMLKIGLLMKFVRWNEQSE